MTLLPVHEAHQSLPYSKVGAPQCFSAGIAPQSPKPVSRQTSECELCIRNSRICTFTAEHLVSSALGWRRRGCFRVTGVGAARAMVAQLDGHGDQQPQ